MVEIILQRFALLCLSRTGDMVDVISNRFQGMYGSWNYFNNNANETMNPSGKEKKQDRDDRNYKEEIQVILT